MTRTAHSLPVLLAFSTLENVVVAKRFTVTGPQLTVTLKDPFQSNGNGASSSSNTKSGAFDPTTGSSASSSNGLRGDFDASFSSLDPCISWTVRSDERPLPDLFPPLESVSASIDYQYKKVTNAPSTFALKLKFGPFLADVLGSGTAGVLQIEPSYHVKDRKTDVAVRVGAGRGFNGLLNLSNRRAQILDFVRTSHKFSLPFSALSSLRITPSFDFSKSAPSCLIEGETGSRRTIAVVDLNVENPTLSVTHALDERNIISPEISLHTAKIMYRWDVTLDSGSIETRVDPTSAIQVTWTDVTTNGDWVTNFNLPLVGSHGPLAADIKVQRRFLF